MLLACRIVLICLAVVLIKVLLNLANAFYLSWRYYQYQRLLKGDTSVMALLLRGKGRTISLFKQAGVSDKKIITSQSIGFGQAVSFEPHMFEQYPSLVEGLAPATVFAFESAIGTYKGRAIDAVNPLYWISLIVYLPTKALAALGAKPDGLPAKVLQGIYWLISACALALWALYKAELLGWLKSLIEKILA